MNSMYSPSLLLLAAIVLLVLELFVPSAGVLGILSGLGFVSAIVLAFLNGGLSMGTLFTAVTAIVVPVVVNYALKLWPKTVLGRLMLIEPTSAEQAVPEGHRQRQQWIGYRGIAVTSMFPSGAILLADRTIDAISDGMPIEKGTEVEVVAVRGVHLIVRPRTDWDFDPTQNPPTLNSPLQHDSAQHDSAQNNSAPQAPSQNAANRPLDMDVPDPFDDSLS